MNRGASSGSAQKPLTLTTELVCASNHCASNGVTTEWMMGGYPRPKASAQRNATFNVNIDYRSYSNASWSGYFTDTTQRLMPCGPLWPTQLQ